jgi:hypothetical protein
MAFELIQKKTLTSSSALVEFDTLPTTYKDLKVIISGRGTASQTRVVSFIRVNNDSTNANYMQFDWYFEDGSAGGEWSNGGARARIMGIFPCTNATSASSFGIAEVAINNYNDTTNYKQINSFLCSYQTTGSWDLWNDGIVWKNTSAITKIGFEPEAGSWQSGSTFYLYGLK